VAAVRLSILALQWHNPIANGELLMCIDNEVATSVDIAFSTRSPALVVELQWL